MTISKFLEGQLRKSLRHYSSLLILNADSGVLNDSPMATPCVKNQFLRVFVCNSEKTSFEKKRRKRLFFTVNTKT